MADHYQVCSPRMHDRLARSRNAQDGDLGCLEATGWTHQILALLDTADKPLRVRGLPL